MSVTTPPRRPDVEHGRDLEQRVADLEALIEEARRRARRRRIRSGVVALLLVGSGVVAFLGFGGHGGGSAGDAALAHKPRGAAAKTVSPSLAALSPEAGFPRAFAFDWRNPEIVYVLTVGNANGGGRVFKTTDGGAHWRATATVANRWVGNNESFAADPRRAGTIYVGTEEAVYKTTNGGRSWHRSTRGLLAPSSRTYDFNRNQGWVTALAVDPADTSVVFAGSDRISKSTNGGLGWTTVFPPHPSRHPAEHVSALAIARTRPETIYAIAGSYPNPTSTPARANTSVYESTDAGKTWRPTTVVDGNVSPTAIAVDPRHPTTVYAAVAGVVLKTTDGGKTWRPIGAGLPVTHTRGGCRCLSLGGVRALAVDPNGNGTVYAALTQGGIYKSTNGGRSWTRTLNQPLIYVATVAVDPSRPATVYAAGQDQSAGPPQILRSTDRGRIWVSAP